MDNRPDEQAPPFDERAALDELERLRGQIERHKARRRAVEEEFDGFISSFKTPGGGAQPAVSQERKRLSPIVASTALAPPAASPEPVQPARRAMSTRRRAAIGGALVVLAGGAFVTWTWARRGPASSTAQASDAAPSAALSATPEPPAARATPSPAATELATSRAVWVRVIADGARVVERELPANARVPLKANKTIVIRTGDAGAVRLSIGGQDQGALGRDGEVVTRTFSLPPRQKP
jgi:hypothetical protein